MGKVENGKLILNDKTSFMAHLLSLKGQVEMIVRKRREKRSLDQNALMWFYAEFMENETGQPADDFVLYWKKKFLRIKFTDPKTKKPDVMIKGSSELSKDEFTDFIKKIQIDSSMEFHVALPDPKKIDTKNYEAKSHQ